MNNLIQLQKLEANDLPKIFNSASKLICGLISFLMSDTEEGISFSYARNATKMAIYCWRIYIWIVQKPQMSFKKMNISSKTQIRRIHKKSLTVTLPFETKRCSREKLAIFASFKTKTGTNT